MPAGFGSVADVWLTVHVSSDEVRRDIEKGAAEADTGKSGRAAGAEWGQGFGEGVDRSGAGSVAARVVDKADTEGSGSRAGTRWGKGFGDGVNRSGAASSLTKFLGTVSGFGDVADASSAKSNIFARAVSGLAAATSVAEPAVSALVVSTTALTSAVAAGGIGLGAYGAAVAPALMRIKELLDLNDKVAQGGAVGAAALKEEMTILQNSPPIIRMVTDQVFNAKDAWMRWGIELSKWTLLPVQRVLLAVNPLLAQMRPFVIQASMGLADLATQFTNNVRSGQGWRDFLATMLPLVRPTIVGIGQAIGNIVAGLGNILQAFAPFSQGMIKGLVDITQKFQDWSDNLQTHSGFQALIAQWRGVWPEVREGLGRLVGILFNVTKAWASMVSPGNTRALWLVLNPFLALVEALSSHPQLVQALTYLYLIGKSAQQIGGMFTSIKSGWEGMTKALGFLTGGRLGGAGVAGGMQGAGDTMLLASRNMQAAAGEMLAASRGEQVAAGEQGAAGAEGAAAGAAAGRGGRIAGIAGRAGIAGAVAVAADLIARALVSKMPRQPEAARQAAVRQGPGWAVSFDKMIFGDKIVDVAAWWNTHISGPIKASLAADRTAIANFGRNIWSYLVASARSTWGSVSSFFASRGRAIAASFGQLGHLLAPAGRAIISGFATAARTVWNSTPGPWLAGLGARAAARVGPLVSTLLSRGRSLISGLHRGASNFWNGTVSPWLHGRAASAQSRVGALVSTLLSRGHNLISGLHRGASSFWNNTVSPWLHGRPGAAQTRVGTLVSTLLSRGHNLISGLHRGATGFWNGTVSPWLHGTGGRALARVGSLAATLLNPGRALITGLHRGVTAVWNSTAAPFLRSIRGLIANIFSGAANWLVNTGRSIMDGLGRGLAAGFEKVKGFVGGVGSWIKAHTGFGSTPPDLLINTGVQIMTGLLQGLRQHWSQVAGWLGNVGPQARGLLNDAISWLTSNGSAAIQGLWNGMQSMWGSVSGWLSGLKNTIASIKGPVSDDLTLLVEHGKAIMTGLLQGLQTGFQGGVQPYLQQVAGWVQEAFSTISGYLPQIQQAVQQYLPQAASLAQQYLPQAASLAQKYLPPQAASFVQGLLPQAASLINKVLPHAAAAAPAPRPKAAAAPRGTIDAEVLHFNDGFADAKRDDAEQGFAAAARWLRQALPGLRADGRKRITGDRSSATEVRAFNDGWVDGKKDDAQLGFAGAKAWLRHAHISFDRGGLIPEMVLGLGVRSGRRYAFHQGENVQPDPGETNRLLAALIRAVNDSAGQTGHAMADALNSAARSASYRSAYSVR